MLTECPRCSEPFDKDEDRIINDECFQCGWATPERKASHNLNTATSEYGFRVEALAEMIYEAQRAYDAACGYFKKPESWAQLNDGRRVTYRRRATKALISRVSPMRTRLIEVRERQRSQDRIREAHPLWEKGEVFDEQVEQEAVDLYRTEQIVLVEDGDQSGFLPWADITRSTRDYYRQRAANAVRARWAALKQNEEKEAH